MPTWPKPPIDEWKREQEERRRRVVVEPLRELPRFVAGADCAYSAETRTTFSVALVWDREANRVVDLAPATLETTVPYVPTFLSFREFPVLSIAIGKLKHPYGAILVDGQGVAHPRRCGLATHLGVELAVPSVGVAKSRLIGDFAEPAVEAGASSELNHKGELIGRVLRTRAKVRPLFVSVGNRIDLDDAVRLVLACVTRYRIPEPTRLADIEVEKLKRCSLGEKGATNRTNGHQ